MKSIVRRREARTKAGPSIRIEDVMTPRALLMTVGSAETDRAQSLADEHEFDAIPIVGQDDVQTYWSRRHRTVKRIVAWQRVAHDASLVDALGRLVKQGVQFVEYHGHIVGLVDLADLNRPQARLVFLHPLLALEQNVALAARKSGLDDAEVARHLGKSANAARKRQANAARADLNVPLLEFAQFGEALKVARTLGIIVSKHGEIERLTAVRNSIFHGSRQPIERPDDGRELLWAFNASGRINSTVVAV